MTDRQKMRYLTVSLGEGVDAFISILYMKLLSKSVCTVWGKSEYIKNVPISPQLKVTQISCRVGKAIGVPWFIKNHAAAGTVGR